MAARMLYSEPSRKGECMARRHLLSIFTTVILASSFCALLAYAAPPSEAEVSLIYAQWSRSTETDDWQTVWSLLGAPSPKVEPGTGRNPEDYSAFTRERQAASAGMQRHVRLKVLRRMTHVDDPDTFFVLVDIDYTLPGSNIVPKSKDLFFYITKRGGTLGLWGFSTQDW